VRLTFRRVLIVSLVGGVTAWVILWWLARGYEPGPNYSQIEEGLWQGGAVRAPPPGTGAVLNLSRYEDPYQATVHLWEPIADAEPAPSIDWLRRMVDFIAARRREGRTVYVHCRNG
jgi:protein-tyrosine phosphatase